METLVNICLIGATGAIGKELVKHSVKNPSVGSVTLLIRRKLPEWENEAKLKFVIRENFDNLEDLAENEDVKACHAFICCLGTRQKTGKENFIKVDFQYPVNFATLAQKLEAPYFGLLTSSGSKSNSHFLYMKTKGQCEDAIQALDLKSFHVYQPGLLVNRDNDFRFGEWLGGLVPFIPKI